jgi:hypothetical protein
LSEVEGFAGDLPSDSNESVKKKEETTFPKGTPSPSMGLGRGKGYFHFVEGRQTGPFAREKA